MLRSFDDSLTSARTDHSDNIETDAFADLRKRKCRCSVARDDEKLDPKRREKLGVLDRVTFDRRE